MLSSYSLPPTLFKVSGAIGKKYVIKQYKKGQVVTRYPDMSRIVPTTRQKVRRRLFARAVRYAQSIYWKGELKAEWRRRLRRPRRLFQALMKQYYRQLSRKREQAESRILKWQRNVRASKAGPALCHSFANASFSLLAPATDSDKQGCFYTAGVITRILSITTLSRNMAHIPM
jgi:hypothetical protein